MQVHDAGEGSFCHDSHLATVILTNNSVETNIQRRTMELGAQLLLLRSK